MTIYLGQTQSDGTVRYVTTSDYNNNRITSILRNFYPTESRVSALIELGNLVTVRPTPIGKSTGYDDNIHCRAEIRDDKEKKGKHLPRYGSEAEFLKLDGHLFLYKDGKWHYGYKEVLSPDLPRKLIVHSTKPLEGLEFYQLDSKGEMSYFYGRDLKNWESIIAKSNEEQSAIFVFRNNKIVTTINHPLNR